MSEAAAYSPPAPAEANHVPAPAQPEQSESTQPQAQRHQGPVSFDMLLKKPKRVVNVGVAIPGEGGATVQVVMKFEALSSGAYDDLQAKYPPGQKDKQEGFTWDPKRFPIALVAASCIEPRMSYEQVEQLYNSPEWSSGEFGSLFSGAIRATQGGLDVPFNARD